MGHLTLKMISIAFASFLIFGLAQAETREQQERQEQEKETTENSKSKKEKQKKAEDREKAQQSINRALRDQGMPHGPVTPPLPPQTK